MLALAIPADGIRTHPLASVSFIGSLTKVVDPHTAKQFAECCRSARSISTHTTKGSDPRQASYAANEKRKKVSWRAERSKVINSEVALNAITGWLESRPRERENAKMRVPSSIIAIVLRSHPGAASREHARVRFPHEASGDKPRWRASIDQHRSRSFESIDVAFTVSSLATCGHSESRRVWMAPIYASVIQFRMPIFGRSFILDSSSAPVAKLVLSLAIG
jgi:hypothetical protein